MSIQIREDKSYMSEVDLLAIEKGIAKLGIHSIRIQGLFTKEQQEENKRIADILSSSEWSARCENHKKEVGQKIEKVIDIINENFVMYQYKNNGISYSKDNWDLFFWCNSMNSGGRDLSYITLNPNTKRTVEQQVKDINNVLELIKTIEFDGNIDIAIQYTCEYIQDKVKEIAVSTFNKIKDTFINYSGMIGKIKEIGIGYDGNMNYGFFKKGASKKYYQVSDTTFLQMAFNQ